jgi:ABC-type lipoprotein export system ATPase subunit
MLLQVVNISKKYPAPGDKGEITVLKDLCLYAAPGESIAVVGPSGCGKTTLLNIIGALDKPTSGIVNFNGRNLADLADGELAKIRNRDIGFVFQLHHLLPQCTVLENILLPTAAFRGKKTSENAQDRAKRLAARIGLEQRLDYFPAQLSGGELQRTAVVRALINKPKLVLADEPTGSLDRENSENLGRLLADLNKEEGAALIVVTHSFTLAENMDNVFRLQDGQLSLMPARGENKRNRATPDLS